MRRRAKVELSGTVVTSGDDFEDAQINATISVASVYTDIPARDEELMKPFFFDAEQHPELFFESTSFEHVEDSTYAIIPSPPKVG